MFLCINYVLSFIMYNVLYDDVHSCILSAETVKMMIDTAAVS